MKELILARVSLIKKSRVFDQHRGICSATHSENRIFSHGNGLSGNELKLPWGKRIGLLALFGKAIS